MKQAKTILLMMLGLVVGLKAYPQIVLGTNLNIGDTLHNSLDGNRGNAIGSEHWLGGSNSLAVGNNDTITSGSNSSVTLGSLNRIQGQMSMAIGADIKIEGMRCVGIGHDLRLSGGSLGCITIGSGIVGTGQHPHVSLDNSYSNCLMIGMRSTKPTLTVSPSPNDYPYDNLVNDRTGMIAIGNIPVPDIAAKLHIRSDAGEDAGIFLEPGGKNGEISFIRMTDERHQIAVDPEGKMLITSEGNGLAVTSANANLTGTELVLGGQLTPRINLTADDSPAIYSNAHRSGNSYRRYRHGSSFAIEFKNNSMLFRTAVYQDPRETEITNWRDALTMKTDGTVTLRGKVGVNRENTTAGYALAVDGGLITTKVYIQDVEDWPDYVFDETYSLMPLRQLKRYVADNRHLPGVPSQAEVESNGYDVNTMQQAMMKTIEELTLYTLQQQEEIEELRRTVEELKKEVRRP